MSTTNDCKPNSFITLCLHQGKTPLYQTFTNFILFPMLNNSVKKKTFTPSNSKRGDTVFSLIVPDNNYGKMEEINIYCWTQGGILNTNRVLIDFDLSDIPDTAVIKKALLSLYFNPISAYHDGLDCRGNQGQDDILIQRVTSDWLDTEATWNKQPKTTEFNQVIIEKHRYPWANYENIDISDIVQDIVKHGNEERYGIMVRHRLETVYNVVFFASSEHPNKRLHPKLEIHYRAK